MARFEHHVAVAWALGSSYAAFHALHHQLPWQEAATAAVLCTVGGILPDIDSPGSRFAEFVFSTGALLGVLIGSHFLHLPLSETSTLGTAVVLFWMLRWGLRYLLSRLTTHRGMVHSLPAAAIWGMLVFLAFSENTLDLRLTMATAAVLGFLEPLSTGRALRLR
ncbi:MAG: metal-dependent hydrolase [Candidatus Kapabacteria bacterium]|nr:metal-dependent hydrolase [Candidatus Kapabacteria bacterium]MDW8011467.1 metal-dependent hydrolase [Bacteroidota bacterium]